MQRTFIPLTALVGGLIASALAYGFPLDQQVVIADRMIHPVRASAGGLSPQERVAKINERLNRIIAHEPLAPSNINLRMSNGEPSIFVGRFLVTSVTQTDADMNRTTPLALARQWLRAYRRVLPQARPGQNWGVVE
jgi:hypothetical protein